MTNHKLAIIYTTVATEEEARTLAKQAVQAKLAACVNVVAGALSIYQWQGKIEEVKEWMLIFKTSPAKAAELAEWVANQHPYSVPAIISTTPDCSAAFSDYIRNATAS